MNIWQIQQICDLKDKNISKSLSIVATKFIEKEINIDLKIELFLTVYSQLLNVKNNCSEPQWKITSFSLENYSKEKYLSKNSYISMY